MCASSNSPILREGYAPVKNAELYYRAIGHGPPIIIIHGGPSFDHTYLLPDMDQLSDTSRLIYYDQRGRGKSVADVHDISIETEVEDIEDLRKHLQLDSVVVLGHSWGGYLAMEYAIRHPKHVSHMILMNTSPASYDDALRFQQELRQRTIVHQERMNALSSSSRYQEGDPETVAEYYRLYFSTTIKQPEHLGRLSLNFPKEGILRGREASKRLLSKTWDSKTFNILPKLKRVQIPTLIIHGDYDFIPVETVSSIAQTIPGARFVLMKDCGHFAYIERPDEVRNEIADFLSVT